MGGHTSTVSSSQISRSKYNLNELGVITVVFNPFKYKSRYELYHKFSKHMLHCGIPLFTVECIFANNQDFDLPKQKFEITRPNEPRHLQLVAPSVIWLKENLINIAVKHLPSSIKYVAWIDADIEFERLDWPYLAIDVLQEYPIVQLFKMAFFLGPSGKKQILRRDYSFVYSIKSEKPIDPNRQSQCYMHPGYAWAMQRESFMHMNGLLDFSILGSGDIHFAYGLINRVAETIPPEVHSDYRRLVELWGERVAEIAGHGKRVGYIPVNIWHYWHGHRRDRKYSERWSIIENFHFSPLNDLEKNDKTNLLRLKNPNDMQNWQSGKRLETLQKNVINYFRSRDEDNKKKPLPTLSMEILVNEPISSINETYRTISHSRASSIENIDYSSDSQRSTNSTQCQSHTNDKNEILL